MTDSNVSSHNCPDKHQYWQQHVSAWRQGGQNQAAYCRQHGLKQYQMSYWKRRLAEPAAGVSFVPIALSSNLPLAVNHPELRLHTPNGYRIDVPDSFDTNVLKQIIVAVQQL